jgi:hypothetical protein
VVPDLEGDPRPVGLADVDRLAVVDVDHRHPLGIDVDAVRRIVVDGDPPALVIPQQQVCARDQRVCDAQIGAQVTSHDYLAARRETALRLA